MTMKMVAGGMAAVAADIVDHTVAGNHNGALDGALVALIVGAIPADPDLAWAGVTEAGFSGYARSGAVVWSAPYLDTNGDYRVDGTAHTFLMTDTVTPQTINAAVLVKVAGAVVTLLAVDLFDTPVNLARAGQGFTYIPSVEIPSDTWGGGAVIQ